MTIEVDVILLAVDGRGVGPLAEGFHDRFHGIRMQSVVGIDRADNIAPAQRRSARLKPWPIPLSASDTMARLSAFGNECRYSSVPSVDAPSCTTIS